MLVPNVGYERWDSLDAVVNVDVGVHGDSVECYDACIGGEDDLAQFLLQWEWVFEVEGLVGDDGLERVDEPFPEGMDKAGAYWSFMDFYCQIEVTKWVESVFLNPIVDITLSVLGEACSSFSCPFIDLCEEVI